jgi:phosphoglycerol transferase MdoB-like AlkP superfamily enzyme
MVTVGVPAKTAHSVEAVAETYRPGSQTRRAAAPRWELSDNPSPGAMMAGAKVLVPLEIHNCSAQPWAAFAGERLAYHWWHEDESSSHYEGIRTLLMRDVLPGESIRLWASLQAPSEVGRQMLQWAMLEENVTWWPVAHNAYAWVNVEAPSSPDFVAPRIESLIWPAQLAAGDEGRVLLAATMPSAAMLSAGLAIEAKLSYGTAFGRTERFSLTTLPPFHADELAAIEVRIPDFEAAVDHAELELSWVQVLADSTVQTLATIGRQQVDVGTRAFYATWSIRGWDASEIASDGEMSVEVKVKNSGYEPWLASDALSYQWLDAKNQVIEEGERFRLGKTVDVGAAVTRTMTVRGIANATQKSATLRVGLVREHEAWAADDERSGEQPRRLMHLLPPQLVAHIEVLEVPRWLAVGEVATARVKVSNQGTIDWDPRKNDFLSYHWVDDAGHSVGEGPRTPLPGRVAPGESFELEAKVRGWERPGDYQLRWNMVRENVRWHRRVDDSQAYSVWIVHQYGWLIAALVAVFLVGALALRHWRRAAWQRGLDRLIFPVLLLGFGFLQAALFHEVAGVALSARGRYGIAVVVAASLSLVIVTRRRLRWWICAAILSLEAALLVADLAYLAFFGAIVSPTQLSSMHQLLAVESSVKEGLRAEFWYFMLVPGLAWVMAALAQIDLRALPKRPRRKLGWLVALVLPLPLIQELMQASDTKAVTHVFSELGLVRKVGIYQAHATNLLRVALDEFSRRHPDDREVAALARAVKDADLQRRERLAHRVDGGVARGANVLLIQVEALQGFVLDLRVNNQEVTPFMNAWHRDEGLDYREIADQSAEGRTSDAEYLALQSNYPLASGALAFRRADNEFFSLAHVLKEAGYRTYSAHPFERGFWNRAKLHPRYGFEASTLGRDFAPGLNTGWGLADGPFFAQALAKIEELPEPWFAFLITLSLHHPYSDFPDELKSLDLADLEGSDVGNWLHAMHYFDQSLRLFVASLRANGKLERSLIVVYGDHDARFNYEERPALLALLGLEASRSDLTLHLDKVPLLVRLPGADSPRRGVMTDVGGQVDIAPSILWALGLDIPTTFQGHPLPLGASAYVDAAARQKAGSESIAIHSDGSVRHAERLYLHDGSETLASGKCFSAGGGQTEPQRACASMAAQAAKTLEISRAMLDLDRLRAWRAGPIGGD